MTLLLQAGFVSRVVGAGRQLGEHSPLGHYLLPVHQLCSGLLLRSHFPPRFAFQLPSSGEAMHATTTTASV